MVIMPVADTTQEVTLAGVTLIAEVIIHMAVVSRSVDFPLIAAVILMAAVISDTVMAEDMVTQAALVVAMGATAVVIGVAINPDMISWESTPKFS